MFLCLHTELYRCGWKAQLLLWFTRKKYELLSANQPLLPPFHYAYLNLLVVRKASGWPSMLSYQKHLGKETSVHFQNENDLTMSRFVKVRIAFCLKIRIKIKPDVVVCIWKPSTWDTETGRALGLTGQPASSNWIDELQPNEITSVLKDVDSIPGGDMWSCTLTSKCMSTHTNKQQINKLKL